MSAALSITAMQPEDYEAVAALWRSAQGVGLAQSDTREGVCGFLTRNPGLSQVARLGQEIVGAVLCGHDGRRGYLYHLAVVEQHRRQGLGKAIVATCLSELAKACIAKATLFVYVDNDAAQQFWRRLGFSDRTDLLVLQKELV